MLEQLESLTPLGEDFPAPSLLEDSTSLAEEGAQPISFFASSSRTSPPSPASSSSSSSPSSPPRARAAYIPAGGLGKRLRSARSARHLLTMIIDYSAAFTKVDLSIACTCLQNLLTSRARAPPGRLPPALAAPDDLIVDALHGIFQAAAALLPNLVATEVIPVLRIVKAASRHLPHDPSVTLPAFLTPLEPHLATYHPDIVALFLYHVADTRAHIPPRNAPAAPPPTPSPADSGPAASQPQSDARPGPPAGQGPPTHLPPSFIAACVAALQPEKLHLLHPFRTASILWSLGAVKHKPSPQWLEAYLRAAVAHIGAFNPQNLQALLWGMASSNPQALPEEWAAALGDQLVALLPSADCQTVCACLKSLGKLNLPVRPANQTAILNYLAGNMGLVPPAIVAKTTWQIAHLQFQPSTAWLKTFYYTTYPLFQRLPDPSSTPQPDRTPSPRALRRRRSTASKYDSTPPADAPAAHPPGRAEPPKAAAPHCFNLQDIANILTALRLWQLRPPAKWLSRCYAVAGPALPAAPPVATAILICEAARLLPQPPDSFLHAAAAALSTPAFAVEGQLLGKALASLAGFEGFAFHPETRRDFFASTQDRLHLWRPVDLTQIFCAIANLGLHPPPAWTQRAIAHVSSTVTADPTTSPQMLYAILVQLARMQPPTDSILATPDNAPPTSAARSVLLTFPSQSRGPLPPTDATPASTPSTPRDGALQPTNSASGNGTTSSSSISSASSSSASSGDAPDPLQDPAALLLTPMARVLDGMGEMSTQQEAMLLTVACRLRVQLTWELLDRLARDVMRVEFHFHLMLLQQVCGMPTPPALRRWRLFFRDVVQERLMSAAFGLRWKALVLTTLARWGWAPSEGFVEDVIGASVVDLVTSDRVDADTLRAAAEELGFEVGAEWEEAYASAFAYDAAVPAFVTGGGRGEWGDGGMVFGE